MSKERKGDNQKLKMLYLVKIFCEETDEHHPLTMPQIVAKLSSYGVNADRKTLYQDFTELRKFGMDIIADQRGRSHMKQGTVPRFISTGISKQRFLVLRNETRNRPLYHPD